jgi:hypothetical protein
MHSAMAQRKLAAKRTPGRNPPFIPFWNQRPSYNSRPPPNNQQWQYNSSNAPPSMSNTPVTGSWNEASSYALWTGVSSGTGQMVFVW